MDSEHLGFRPSPYLKKLLGFAPHQVFDEHGQTSYTLKDGAIRIDLRRPLIAPVAYIKIQDQTEGEEDSGEEDEGSLDEDNRGGRGGGAGEGEDNTEGPTIEDLYSPSENEGAEDEEGEDSEQDEGEREEREERNEDAMEEDGGGEDSSPEEESRDTLKELQQNGPVVSSSGISLVCPEYGGDSEDD